MLTSMFFYAGIGCRLDVNGDHYVDGHHTVEDTACYRTGVKIALGDKGYTEVSYSIFPWMKRFASRAGSQRQSFLGFDAPMPGGSVNTIPA